MKGIKILIGVIIGLAVIIAAYTIIDSKTGETNYRNVIVKLDSAAVTKFIFTPKGQKTTVEIVKKDGAWTISSNKKKFSGDESTIANIIDQLKLVKPQRVAATTKDAWKEYEVNDSAGVPVQIFCGNDKVADLVIGKFTFKQSKNPYQRQPDVTSYIRLVGENDVYAVSGMLSFIFNRSADDFRNRAIVKAKAQDLEKVTFIYPADSSFTITKKDNTWTIGGKTIDSLATVTYVNLITNATSFDFVDSTVVPATPVYSIKIEGKNMLPITINAFQADTTNGVYIESSINKGSYFSGKRSGLFSKLYVPKSQFVR